MKRIETIASLIERYLQDNPKSTHSEIMEHLDISDNESDVYHKALGSLIAKGVVAWDICYHIRREGEEYSF